MSIRNAPAPTFTMKRLALALLAVAALLTPLLLRDSIIPGAGAQTVTVVAPVFTPDAFTSPLDVGADGSGSGNAITVGAYSYTASSGGGSPTHVCAVTAAVQNNSVDPDDHTATATSPYTDVTGFQAAINIADGTCDLTYTGTGLSGFTETHTDDDGDPNTPSNNDIDDDNDPSTPVDDDDGVDGPDTDPPTRTVHPVVSVTITIHDSLDSTGGADTTTIDDTLEVTVRLVGLGTDQLALEELYRDAGGSDWTRRGGFADDPIQTFRLTAGSSGTLHGYGAGFGAARGATSFTLNGRTYTLAHFTYDTNGNSVSFGVTTDDLAGVPSFAQAGMVTSDFRGLQVRIGSVAGLDLPAPTLSNGVWTFEGPGGGTGGAGSFPRRRGGKDNSVLPPFPRPSGAFDLVLQAPAQDFLTSTWHGATVSGLRLTRLDLSANNLSGTPPDSLGLLSSLTHLDLSDNPNLRGPIPVAWEALTLTANGLSLAGSGLCADTNTRMLTWARRWLPSSEGLITCGPQFAETSPTLRLDAGEANVVIGGPAFRGGLHPGATDTCAITAQAENASDAIGDHDTTGTAVTDFTIDSATCAITYGGTGATRTDGTLEAYSLVVTLTDTVGSGSDHSADVTVKIVDAQTDRAALNALYTATAGASWTTRTNWLLGVEHTFALTAGVDGTGAGAFTGYAPATGSARSGGMVTLGGQAYTLQDLLQWDQSNNLKFSVSPATNAGTNFAGKAIRIGTNTFTIAASSAGPPNPSRYDRRWTSGVPAGLFTDGQDFDAHLLGASGPPDSFWHGVTVDANGRVTALNLNDNNLAGTLPGDLADLTKLRTLDLGGNGSLMAVAAGSNQLDFRRLLEGLTNLTSLDLRGVGVCEQATTTPNTHARTLSNWLAGLRTAGATVNVADCAGGGPSFTAAAVTYRLDGSADGSTMAIELGTPAITEGAAPNGTNACAIEGARATGDDETFALTGASTAALFSIDAATCAISYVGAAGASAYAAGSQEGFSLVVSLTDGVNGGGATDATIDATMRVSVKLLSEATDREALAAIYDATGGRNWTTRTNWKQDDDQRITLTGSTDSGEVGYNSDGATTRGGVQPYASYPTPQTPPASATRFTLGGTTYTLVAALRDNSSGAFTLRVTPQGDAAHFDGLSVLIGTPGRQTQTLGSFALQGITLAFDDATETEPSGGRTFEWATGGPGAPALNTNFDVVFLKAPLSAWHGVTVAGMPARVTELDLSNNNLRGKDTMPAQLAELTGLTTLNLSGNANLSERVPAELTRLPDLAALDLSGTGYCIDPVSAPAVETWLSGIRSGMDVLVTTCGSPVAPEFRRTTDFVRLDAGEDGSTNAIAIGTYAVTDGTFSGGATPTCSLDVYQNPSAAPGDHITMGTAGSGFSFATSADGDGNLSCVITYTGTGATRTGGTLEAYSLVVGINDGVTDTGAVSTDADDTVAVTVKLLDIETDGLALWALYQSTNGAGWTNNSGWTQGATPTAAWNGVTVASARVTELDLNNNGLRGRIPAQLAELTKLTTLDLSDNNQLRGFIPDLSGTAVSSLDLEGTNVEYGANSAARAWLATLGMNFTPGDAPVVVGSTAPSGSVTVSVSAAGNAPAGITYQLTLSCGGSAFQIALAAGGNYNTPVANGSSCSLSATDSQGASSVSGEFSFLVVNGPVFRTVVFTHPAETPADDGMDDDAMDEEPVDDDSMDEEPAVEPNPQLEAEIVIGNAFVAWEGEATPVAEAVAGLTLRVTAVYRWDARSQRWHSWFPNAEGLGVNTIDSFEQGSIYGVYAQERPRGENGN